MKFIFYLLYYPLAFTYDLVATVVSLGQWWDWQAQALPHVPTSGVVLEVGHGTGHLLTKLQQRGNQPIGMDLSPNMGRLAQRWLRKHKTEGVPLLQGSVMQLSFAANTIPAIVSTFPTEYIVNPQTLAEFQRVLQPAGKLVIVPNATLNTHSPLAKLMRWLFRVTGQAPMAAEQKLPEELWLGKLSAALEGAGFTVARHAVTLPKSIVFVVVAAKTE